MTMAIQTKLNNIIVYNRAPEDIEMELEINNNLFQTVPYLYDVILKYQRLDILKYLKNKGYDLHVDEDKLLMASVGANNLKFVKYLVDNGANIDAQNYRAFFIAVSKDNFEITDYFIKSGGVNSIDRCNAGLQFIESLDMLKLLIKSGADINNVKYSFFEHQYSNVAIMKYLIEKGININLYKDKAIEKAIYDENLEVVKLLLKNADYSKEQLNELFIYACNYDNVPIIKFLSGKGIDINYKNNLALKTASSNFLNVVQYLVIKQKQNINDVISITNNDEIRGWAIKYKENLIIKSAQDLDDKLPKNAKLIKSKFKV